VAALWITADDLSDPTNVEAKEAARAASMLLYELSGRRYSGIYEVTELYERPEDCSGYRLNRIISATRDYYAGYGSCLVHRRRRFRLRRTPIQSITALRVDPDGDNRLIDPSEYQVVDRAYVRAVAGATWSPCTQDLTVTYVAGARVPEAGLRAARVLGNELLKARVNPDACQLPDRVTSVARQGVSYTILDSQDFLEDGRTGLYEVDLFLRAANPDKARKRARVFSPDLPRAGRLS
jgi:hypothetical protein